MALDAANLGYLSIGPEIFPSVQTSIQANYSKY